MVAATKAVIAGARVLDGTGAPAQWLDVFLADGKIAELRPHGDHHGRRSVIDATGLTLAPGFIDVHSHADNAPFLENDDLTKILQGVTTEVVGNCGVSLAPRDSKTWSHLAKYRERSMPPLDYPGETFADFLAETDRRGYVTNYAPLVGHGTLRIAAMGMQNRAPATAERAKMRAHLEEALDAGAFGMSSGLIYPPGVYSTTEELIELAGALRPNTLYTTHMRGESATLLESTAEAIAIGETAGVRVQISHHKAAGKENFGKTAQTLAMIAQARERGLEIFQDVYPYTAGSTALAAVIPPEFHEGGDEKLLERLSNPGECERMERIITQGRPGYENLAALCGWDGLLVSSSATHAFEGRTIAEIAVESGRPPFAELVRVLVSERLRATVVAFMMDEGDVKRVLADEYTAIGSDGQPPGLGGKPHPRLFGTFPRVLSRYARELAVVPLEKAVYKMTGLPARIFRLSDRGTIAPGKAADLVAFDAAAIADDLDYRDPCRVPKGIAWVMLAGTTVVRGTQFIRPRRGVRLRPGS